MIGRGTGCAARRRLAGSSASCPSRRLDLDPFPTERRTYFEIVRTEPGFRLVDLDFIKRVDRAISGWLMDLDCGGQKIARAKYHFHAAVFRCVPLEPGIHVNPNLVSYMARSDDPHEVAPLQISGFGAK